MKSVVMLVLIVSSIFANNKMNSVEKDLFKTFVKDDIYMAVDGGEAVFAKYIPKIIVTNADTIQREYESNEIFADNKYKSHNIVINGIVKKIRKDAWNNLVIDLIGGSNRFIYPKVQVNKNYIKWLSQVKINTNVYLVCSKSKSIASSTYLSNCIPSYS